MRPSGISRREFGRLSSVGAAAAWLPARDTGDAIARTAGRQESAGRLESAGSLTDVAGIRVGHYTDSRRPTGCTVILFDSLTSFGAIAAELVADAILRGVRAARSIEGWTAVADLQRQR
jgi:L-aminopeptidase/D-esterase-like protein